MTSQSSLVASLNNSVSLNLQPRSLIAKTLLINRLNCLLHIEKEMTVETSEKFPITAKGKFRNSWWPFVLKFVLVVCSVFGF